MAKMWLQAGLGSVSLLLAGPSVVAQTHPLDALQGEELTTVVKLLQKGQYIDKNSRFTTINLKEPPKNIVWKWKPGQPLPPREAFAVVVKNTKAFEGVINLSTKTVTDWKEIPGVQPSVTEDEYELAEKLMLADPQIKAGLAKRGIKNVKKEVECSAVAPGYFGPQVTGDRRLLAGQCTLKSPDQNEYAHPISGLLAYIDLTEKKIIKVEDTGALPLPRKITSMHQPKYILKQVGGKLNTPAKPLVVSQPQGTTFKVRGQMVNFLNWQFHFRMDPRVGLVVSTVTYNDKGKVRPVMYSGAMAEIFVPYGDPGLDMYYRTYLDAGEFYVGRDAAPLQKNLDCPANAVYFDATFIKGDPLSPKAKGGLDRHPNVVCLYEQRSGIEWRHSEFSRDDKKKAWNESRSRHELVLRSISTIGNYDYIFDWIFLPDGAIRVVVNASGTEETKGIKSKTLADDHDHQETKYGTLVAEHISATTHQHIYNYRLDMDVDGVTNNFMEATPKAVPVENSPRKSGMVVEEKTFTTELEARRSYDPMPLWHVVNPNLKNANGYNVSYVLQKGENSAQSPLLTADDWPRKRAGFIDYALWVTPYTPKELFAAGDYPNQSKGGDGLPRWTQADRPIANTDIVLWYSFGLTHVVRPEDWPVLSSERASFELRPFNFFSQNPSLGQPKY